MPRKAIKARGGGAPARTGRAKHILPPPTPVGEGRRNQDELSETAAALFIGRQVVNHALADLQGRVLSRFENFSPTRHQPALMYADPQALECFASQDRRRKAEKVIAALATHGKQRARTRSGYLLLPPLADRLALRSRGDGSSDLAVCFSSSSLERLNVSRDLAKFGERFRVAPLAPEVTIGSFAAGTEPPSTNALVEFASYMPGQPSLGRILVHSAMPDEAYLALVAQKAAQHQPQTLL